MRLQHSIVLIVIVAVVGCLIWFSSQSPTDRPVSSFTDQELEAELDRVLNHTYAERRLSLGTHTAWQIIHGAVAFKRDFLINDEQGQVVPAISHVLAGRKMRGWTFVPGDMIDGRRGLRSVVESGTVVGQGHPDQWLGYLAEAGLSPDQTIIYDDKRYTIGDVIRQVKKDVPNNPGREYSWTLMALTTYFDTSHKWIAGDGKEWSIEQLVEIEIGQDPVGSACGGCHRLGGLAMALGRHIAQQEKAAQEKAKQEGGEPQPVALTGVWAKADAHLKKYIQQAKRDQNGDGSFSANFFQRTGITKDVAQDVRATGHIFEFLMFAMTDQEVREPWVRRAAEHLTRCLRDAKDTDFECGALYHGVHGMLMYRERTFGPRTFRQLVPNLVEVPIPEERSEVRPSKPDA